MLPTGSDIRQRQPFHLHTSADQMLPVRPEGKPSIIVHPGAHPLLVHHDEGGNDSVRTCCMAL
jgi:hypothetical protein